jgi:hypothetical protein
LSARAFFGASRGDDPQRDSEPLSVAAALLDALHKNQTSAHANGTDADPIVALSSFLCGAAP